MFAARRNLRLLFYVVPFVCASGPVTTELFPAIRPCLSHLSVESVKASADCCLTDAFDDDRKKGLGKLQFSHLIAPRPQ